MKAEHRNKLIQYVMIGAIVGLLVLVVWIICEYMFPGLLPLVRTGD